MPSFRVVLESPIGPLTAVGDDHGLRELLFGPSEIQSAQHPISEQLKRELEEYFQRRRIAFEIPLRPSGTPFQLAVWELLRQIPFGQTRTYSELAEALGDRDKTRAVGAANGANPIPILIPCHRVIGKDGSLTGYAGGKDIKRALLELESAQGGLF